jgi:hypothetical protein
MRPQDPENISPVMMINTESNKTNAVGVGEQSSTTSSNQQLETSDHTAYIDTRRTYWIHGNTNFLNGRRSVVFLPIIILLSIMCISIYQSLQYTQQYDINEQYDIHASMNNGISTTPVVTKETPSEVVLPAPVVLKDDSDRAHIKIAVNTTVAASAPSAETLSAPQEKDSSPGNVIVKEADAAIQGKAEMLQNLNIRYYMYDHPNITLSNITFPKKARKILARYHNEASNDAQMLAALEQSPLRTLRPEDAELYIPPIQMAKILICKSADFLFHLAFETLVNHELFRQHQGNKHILISTPFILYRSDKLSHMVTMRKWHPLIYNVTPVLSWDPNAVYNAVKEGFDFKAFDNFDWVEPLSRRSFSVGLGDGVSIKYKYSNATTAMELQLASLEKFQNSSNLIFYQTRAKRSDHNSTIFRHAPVKNINHGDFPKSSIGFGLKNHEWLREFQDSKFCLVIRGDSPHSHSLWRAIRLGCIPVIAADSLPIFSPMFKSTLNMSEYAVLVSEQELVTDTEKTLLKLQDMSDAEVEAKVKHLAFAQRVIMVDHPQSLFVPALLYEATMASEVAFV